MHFCMYTDTQDTHRHTANICRYTHITRMHTQAHAHTLMTHTHRHTPIACRDIDIHTTQTLLTYAETHTHTQNTQYMVNTYSDTYHYAEIQIHHTLINDGTAKICFLFPFKYNQLLCYFYWLVHQTIYFHYFAAPPLLVDSLNVHTFV